MTEYDEVSKSELYDRIEKLEKDVAELIEVVESRTGGTDAQLPDRLSSRRDDPNPSPDIKPPWEREGFDSKSEWMADQE